MRFAHVWVNRTTAARYRSTGLRWEVTCDMPTDGTLLALFVYETDANTYAAIAANDMADCPDFVGVVRLTRSGGRVELVEQYPGQQFDVRLARERLSAS